MSSRFVIGGVFCVLLSVPAFADKPQDVCSVTTLNGAYGVLRQGQVVGDGYLTAVGVANFDGLGYVSGYESIIRSGGAPSHESFTQTYTVNEDCFGTINDTSGNVIRRIAIARDGDQILGMSRATGNVESVEYERIAPPLPSRNANDDAAEADCSAGAFAGTYAFQRSGHIPAGALLATGMLFSDGVGQQTAEQTIDRNGVFSESTIAGGGYSVGPDCFGNGTTPAGVVFTEFVLVHGGREVLGISESGGNNVIAHYERIAEQKP